MAWSSSLPRTTCPATSASYRWDMPARSLLPNSWTGLGRAGLLYGGEQRCGIVPLSSNTLTINMNRPDQSGSPGKARKGAFLLVHPGPPRGAPAVAGEAALLLQRMRDFWCMPSRATITILCSGVALGVYVPALLVNHQLRARGAATEVVVLESLFTAEKQARILQNKAAFHRDFAVAKMGQRMARDVRPNLDAQRVERLYQGWVAEERRLFIVFSGFWMPLLEVVPPAHRPGRPVGAPAAHGRRRVGVVEQGHRGL